MEIIYIIGGIVALFMLYFATGIILKFIVGWFPVITGICIGVPIIAFKGGWSGTIIGLVIIVGSVFTTDSWHGSEIYLNIEEKIENKFYLND